MMNILGRLPVKTLLRSKTVSKHWLSLISDPTFINSHLRDALEHNESLIFHGKRGFHNSILLRNVDSSVDLPYFEAKLLPAPRCLVRGFPSEYLGFGFDPIANDFKVVRNIVHYNDKHTHAMVYSTNANAWKEIKHPKIIPRWSVSDACVNGVLYWTCYHGVIRYDMNNEVFYDHTFPADVISTGDSIYLCERIMEIKNSIAVIMTADMGRFKSKVNLWTVDDGFERSWTLRYSFETSEIGWVHGYLNSTGDFLFRTRIGKWLLHNLDKNVVKRASVPECTSEIFKYTESLVPITGSEDLGKMLMKVEMEDEERRGDASKKLIGADQLKH